MSDYSSGSLDLDDEDRLPWLEPAGDDDYDDSVSLGRLLGFIVGGLALLGLIVGAVYMVRNYLTPAEDATLIAAPEGDYKVPAEDADAKKFDGEGDAVYAASEGIDRNGKIDPSRLPEKPVISGSASKDAADKANAPAASSEVKTKVADNTSPAATPAPVPEAAPKLTGPMIQLGAYGSEAIAQDAWKRFSKRFDYLAGLTHSVQPVTVGGSKFYRLRASAGKDASTLCGKLKVAGENCIVVN
ncbi:MAG: SPOR domain-containing protein [Sphingobium sp.]|nr:SPOR domain-containing protein [Sphingobium sp.]MCP5398005.1 SPOR domain-containing protein [Sphingomonas sp.]